jgi:hypothetical protein
MFRTAHVLYGTVRISNRSVLYYVLSWRAVLSWRCAV